jgi:hypothetical protein
MMSTAATRRLLHSAYAGLAVGLLFLAGCGGSGSTATQGRSAATPAANKTTSAASTAARTPPPTLHVLAPTRGAHTGSTVTVSVRLTGSAPGASHVFRYLLDGRKSRRGAAHVTFDELGPGPHHLVVALANDAGVHAVSSFVVRAPTPVPAAEPVQGTTTTTPAPAPSARPAEPPMSRPAAKPSAPAPSSSGIPQGNGGDQDEDNNGGPSDGDGNI